MNKIATRIRLFLEEHEIDINLLAKHLEYKPEELQDALNDPSIEMRLVEQISKNFRVPLYSFFSSSTERGNYVFSTKPKIKENVQALKMKLAEAYSEIARLKNALRDQELLINRLQNELNS